MSYFPEIANDGLRLIIAKFSNSRKEIEIRIVSDKISQYENFSFRLGGEPVSPATFYQKFEQILKPKIDSNDTDVVVPVGDGSYIPVVNLNYYVDSTLNMDDATQDSFQDASRFLFVIKLSKPLPPSFKKLGNLSTNIRIKKVFLKKGGVKHTLGQLIKSV